MATNKLNSAALLVLEVICVVCLPFHQEQACLDKLAISLVEQLFDCSYESFALDADVEKTTLGKEKPSYMSQWPRWHRPSVFSAQIIGPTVPPPSIQVARLRKKLERKNKLAGVRINESTAMNASETGRRASEDTPSMNECETGRRASEDTPPLHKEEECMVSEACRVACNTKFRDFSGREGGFYETYAKLFQRIDKEEVFLSDQGKHQETRPLFGTSASPDATVITFYRHWSNFFTRKWPRNIKKKAQYNLAVRELVAHVQQQDPRWADVQQSLWLQAVDMQKQARAVKAKTKPNSTERAQAAARSKERRDAYWAERLANGESVFVCTVCCKNFKSQTALYHHNTTKLHMRRVAKLNRSAVVHKYSVANVQRPSADSKHMSIQAACLPSSPAAQIGSIETRKETSSTSDQSPQASNVAQSGHNDIGKVSPTSSKAKKTDTGRMATKSQRSASDKATLADAELLGPAVRSQIAQKYQSRSPGTTPRDVQKNSGAVMLSSSSQSVRSQHNKTASKSSSKKSASNKNSTQTTWQRLADLWFPLEKTRDFQYQSLAETNVSGDSQATALERWVISKKLGSHPATQRRRLPW